MNHEPDGTSVYCFCDGVAYIVVELPLTVANDSSYTVTNSVPSASYDFSHNCSVAALSALFTVNSPITISNESAPGKNVGFTNVLDVVGADSVVAAEKLLMVV